MKEDPQGFEKWNPQKQKIHFKNIRPFFREGEIRWAYLGKNVGTEIVGKGNAFSRPVLVFKKLYGHSCLVFPLTTKTKEGSYYGQFMDRKGEVFCAAFSQVRYLDGKRIREKISSVTVLELEDLQEKYFHFMKNRPERKRTGGATKGWICLDYN